MPLYTKNTESTQKLIAKFLPRNKFFIISGSNLDENNLRENIKSLCQNWDIAGEGK